MKKFRIPSKYILIFLVVFFIELCFGFYMCYIKGVILSDAFSRTANSFYVLMVKPVRFASIGLVWNPLPSVLQLPFILFSKIWRPIASKGLSAVIVNSIFSGISAVLIIDTFKRFKTNRKFVAIATFLYVFNPFIFYYGCNGMSEGIFFTIIIFCICKLTLWMKFGKSRHIVEIAFAFVFLFFTRYEAIPFAFSIGLCIIIRLLFCKNERKYWVDTTWRERYFYVEGTMTLLYTPMAYSILLWVIFNWVISKNPIYFLNSAYSNISQSIFSSDFGTVTDIFIYVIQRSIPFISLFIAILLIRIITKRTIKSDIIGLSLIVFIMIAFHFYMLQSGKSFGWLRFFAYCLPICFSWIPYEISELKSENKKTGQAICIAALFITFILCTLALQDPDLSKEEHNLVISDETKKVADYINTKLQDETILMDCFLTNNIVLNIDNVDHLIVSSSLNFGDCVKDPVGMGVGYILVPDTSGVGNLDAINSRYPTLYKEGAEWCQEEESFTGYKLYRVNE